MTAEADDLASLLRALNPTLRATIAARIKADDQLGTFAEQFAGASGEKHAMPGSVVRAPGVTWTLDYDCFTAQGTSGAPVVDLQGGTVVGMHVAGTKAGQKFKLGIAIDLSRFADVLR